MTYPNTDFRISRTTALWLIQVCTKIVRDGLNFPWHPVSTEIARTRQGSYLNAVINDLDPQRASWVQAMFSVCRMLAAALAFQLDDSDLGLLTATNPDVPDVTSVETISGLGNDYFGLGEDQNT